MLEMFVDIFNMHDYILADLVGARRLKLAALTAQHDRALRDGKLRMGDAAIRTRGAQALGEAEGVAKPIHRLRHVFVDEDGYYCYFRCRPVDHHTHLLVFEGSSARPRRPPNTVT